MATPTPKAITDLPVASIMGDDDLLVVSQNATTSSIKGELIKSYAQNAVASQVTAAQTAATQAANSATNAESARQGAEDAQEAAESAQTSAEQAATEATNAAGTIGDSVEQAQGYATQAGSARDAAISAQQAAETAEDNAVSAKTAAETAQTAAEGSATQAAGSATTAQSAATQAGDAKTDAETARNEAETSASSAANSASDAESAATEAEQAKTYIENMDMEGETLPAGSSVTVTKTTSPEGNLLFVIGVPQGIQGDKGDPGETGATGPQGVSVINATVNEDGDLVITLSSGSPINAGSVIGPQGIQGEVGPTGASVDRIERTSGTGAPGTTDTYTVYLTDGQTGGTFQVYNGSNGTGSGDFMSDGSVPMTGALQMGGHKITSLAEPTDNTDAASKEYVDDTITVSLVGNYIPVGQKGQANGVASLDGSGKVPSAQLPPMDYVPTSRTVNGHALSADVTLDAEDVGARPDTWTPSAEDVGAIPNPTGGTTGQVLTKTATGEEWSDAPSGLPEGGTEGQILKRGASGAEWDDAEWLPLSGGIMDNAVRIRWGSSSGPFISSGVITPELRLCSKSVNYVNTNLYIGRSPDTGNNVAYLNYDNNELRLHLGGEEDTVGRLTGLKTPVASNEATPKSYVDTQLSTKLTTPTGTQGQLLGFTADNVVGAVDGPEGLPSGGSEGQMLYKTADGTEWGDKPVMYVNITESGGTYSADKTFAEIESAIESEYSVVVNVKDGNEEFEIGFILPLAYFASGTVVLFALYLNGFFYSASVASNNFASYSKVRIPANNISFTPTSTLTSDNVQDAIEEVQANVDAYKPDRKTVALSASDWSSNTQTVTVSGVSATETAQLITPTPAIASQSAYYEAGIMCTNQAANSLTFTCQTVPTSNLTVYVVIQPLS